MADNTHIGWTDATWNPVRGCSRVSPGCGGANHEGGCYAEKIAARFSGPGQPYEGFARRTPNGGQWTGKLALVEESLDLPLRWKRPRRIFVNSMSDLFHEALPDAAIDQVLEVIGACDDQDRGHIFQILTKRGVRQRDYMRSARAYDAWNRRCMAQEAWPPRNIWLGVSVEDQERKHRIDELRATPAAIRFLSLEPLLEDLGAIDLTGIHWVIVGGESGPRARPMHPDWARSLRDQCQAAGVAFFFKQWGEWIAGDDLPSEHQEAVELGERRLLTYDQGQKLAGRREYEFHSDGSTLIRVGKHAAGRLLDGREHNEFPV